MADPSHSIHDRMLPHLHLVSTYRYPEKISVAMQDATNWLLSAPKIARDTAPFYWTYLDAPRDGQIMLTWQPLQRMDTNFASDGYIWPGPDQYVQQDLGNGLILENFFQKVGYRPGEQVAAHARNRFRLVPKQGVPNAPQVDPSLWLVHYGPAQQPIPAGMIPVTPAMNSIMQNRMHLQRGGQIARKDFMLADRMNWPTINPPRDGRGHPMMAQPPNARAIPQQMAYPPPPKRSRTAAHAQPQMISGSAHFLPFDDDEDTSAGDMFDHLTPREISMTRYTRNHEWMEEILNSAYRIGQIAPADLGLGLQGELSSMTQGIFESSGVDAHKKPPTKPVVGHLDPELAEQFRKRVADKILADQNEMAQMKAQHEKQLEKLKPSSLLLRAEKDLRTAVDETGPEVWRLEGKEGDDEEGSSRIIADHNRKVDDIVADIESALGRHIEVVSDVRRVQDGGYQEPAPEPEILPVPPAPSTIADSISAGPVQLSKQPSQQGSQNGGAPADEADVDMGGTATGPIDQMQTEASSSSINQAHSSMAPSAGPATINVGAPPQQQPAGQVPGPGDTSEDVTMQDSGPAKDTNTAPDQGTGSGDWVVVPKGGVSPGAPSSEAPVAAQVPSQSEPAQGLPDAAKAVDADFGDINTAGEALSSYDQQNDDTTGDIGDGMDLGVEDSAFGDAVFGVEESRGSAANTPADGM